MKSKTKVGVIGLGYVGLPLALLISKNRFQTFGFDRDLAEKSEKNINFYILSRLASAATATGYAKVHAKEQAEILNTAFSI